MSAIACTQCKKPLTPEFFNNSGYSRCNSCGSNLKVSVFPALYRPIPRGQTGETVLVAEESTCFYHAEKKAVVPCEGCGRFLCGLCDMEIDGKHLCPSCMERGVKKGKLINLQNQRMLYDTLALLLAVVPVASLIFWVFSAVAAPASLFIVIKYWNAPTTILQRGKARFVIALILSIIQIVGWLIFLVHLITNRW